MRYSKVVLCGRRCTGKTTLFWNLQKELGWPTFSISQYLRDFIRIYQVSPFEVEARSREVTAEIESRINGIITGPNQVIIEARIFQRVKEPLEGVLKVLLSASEQVRVVRAAGREKTSVERIGNKLLKKEEDWLERMSKLYGFSDLFEPSYFDLVIDTDPLTPEQVSDVVLKAIKI